MALRLVTVPCRTDNYAFLLHDAATGATAVVDVPEAGPVKAALAQHGWRLTDILITHHHDDHVAGVADLCATTGARVTGAAADAHRLPPIERAVRGGDRVEVGGEGGVVIEVPGHTVGHIAFHFPASNLVFTADSLMAMGCGRLFEGTAAQMWQSLVTLAALPPETLICSGHEYTAANMRFARALEPDAPALILREGEIAAMRKRGDATVPSSLATERATNPYLRAHEPGLRAALGLQGASDLAVFTEVRLRKDRF